MAKSKPKMFTAPTDADKIAQAQKLSSLKNLGPVLEKVLNSVGITTVDQLKKVGWQIVIGRLMRISPRYLMPIYAYVIIGALHGVVWNQISDKDKKAVKDYLKNIIPNAKEKMKQRSAAKKTKIKRKASQKKRKINRITAG